MLRRVYCSCSCTPTSRRPLEKSSSSLLLLHQHFVASRRHYSSSHAAAAAAASTALLAAQVLRSASSGTAVGSAGVTDLGREACCINILSSSSFSGDHQHSSSLPVLLNQLFENAGSDLRGEEKEKGRGGGGRELVGDPLRRAAWLISFTNTASRLDLEECLHTAAALCRNVERRQKTEEIRSAVDALVDRARSLFEAYSSSSSAASLHWTHVDALVEMLSSLTALHHPTLDDVYRNEFSTSSADAPASASSSSLFSVSRNIPIASLVPTSRFLTDKEEARSSFRRGGGGGGGGSKESNGCCISAPNVTWLLQTALELISSNTSASLFSVQTLGQLVAASAALSHALLFTILDESEGHNTDHQSFLSQLSPFTSSMLTPKVDAEQVLGQTVLPLAQRSVQLLTLNGAIASLASSSSNRSSTIGSSSFKTPSHVIALLRSAVLFRRVRVAVATVQRGENSKRKKMLHAALSGSGFSATPAGHVLSQYRGALGPWTRRLRGNVAAALNRSSLIRNDQDEFAVSVPLDEMIVRCYVAGLLAVRMAPSSASPQTAAAVTAQQAQTRSSGLLPLTFLERKKLKEQQQQQQQKQKQRKKEPEAGSVGNEQQQQQQQPVADIPPVLAVATLSEVALIAQLGFWCMPQARWAQRLVWIACSVLVSKNRLMLPSGSNSSSSSSSDEETRLVASVARQLNFTSIAQMTAETSATSLVGLVQCLAVMVSQRSSSSSSSSSLSQSDFVLQVTSSLVDSSTALVPVLMMHATHNDCSSSSSSGCNSMQLQFSSTVMFALVRTLLSLQQQQQQQHSPSKQLTASIEAFGEQLSFCRPSIDSLRPELFYELLVSKTELMAGSNGDDDDDGGQKRVDSGEDEEIASVLKAAAAAATTAMSNNNVDDGGETSPSSTAASNSAAAAADGETARKDVLRGAFALAGPESGAGALRAAKLLRMILLHQGNDKSSRNSGSGALELLQSLEERLRDQLVGLRESGSNNGGSIINGADGELLLADDAEVDASIDSSSATVALLRRELHLLSNAASDLLSEDLRDEIEKLM